MSENWAHNLLEMNKLLELTGIPFIISVSFQLTIDGRKKNDEDTRQMQTMELTATNTGNSKEEASSHINLLYDKFQQNPPYHGALFRIKRHSICRSAK